MDDKKNTDGIVPPHKKTKIESAQEKLDSMRFKVKEKPRSHLHKKPSLTAHTWSESDTPQAVQKSKTASFVDHFKKFFMVAAVFFVAAVTVAVFSFMGGSSGVSRGAIDLEILTRSFVNGGEPIEVTVEIVNNNPVPLELADLIVQHPQASQGVSSEMVRTRRSIGTLMPGVPVRETFEIILFGEEGEVRDVEAILEYRIANSNAIFTRENSVPIAIQSTPLDLRIVAPVTTIPNQRITFDVFLNTQSTEIMRNIMVGLEYPSDFTFEEASLAPTFGQNTWLFDEIDVGEEIRFSVTGTLGGFTNDLKVFRAFAGNQSPSNERQIQTVFNSAITDIMIRESFVQTTLAMGNDTSDSWSRNSGQRTNFSIDIFNPHSEPIRDLEVIVRIGGSAYDASSITSNQGFFDSNTQSVRFTKDTIGQFANLGPQQSRNIRFELAARPLVIGTNVIDQPEITLAVDARGIDATGRILEARNLIERNVLINSDLQLTRRTLFYGGPFANNGEYPPRVGQTTDMTIVWTVTNTSNTIEDGVVTATLPSYVTWNNRVTPAGENISYNSATRQVHWDLGDIERGTGFSSSARTVSFQVSLTPSLSQRGTSPLLTSDVILEGRDRYTENTLRDVNREHSTRLLNDSQSGNGQVVAD